MNNIAYPRGLVLTAAWLFGVIALATPTGATTVVEMSFDDVCLRAERILCGTVESITSRLNPDNGSMHTYTRFVDVRWVTDGEAAADFTVRTLGGVVGAVSLRVSGMPTFEIGRRYVIFVRGNGQSVCPLVGWHQGCFRIENDYPGAVPTVMRLDGTGANEALHPPRHAAEALNATASDAPGDIAFSEPMTLATFLQEIRKRREATSLKSDSPTRP